MVYKDRKKLTRNFEIFFRQIYFFEHKKTDFKMKSVFRKKICLQNSHFKSTWISFPVRGVRPRNPDPV